MCLSTRSLLVGIACVSVLDGARAAGAAEPPPRPEELAAFVRQVVSVQVPAARAAENTETPQYSVSARGFLNYVSAPAGQHFPPPAGAAGRSAGQVARDFVVGNRRWFGISSPHVDFVEKRASRFVKQRHNVRLQQVYRGLPIIAGEATVQLNEQKGVESVLCDFETNWERLDDGRVAIQPAIASEVAASRGRSHFAAEAGSLSVQSGPARLAIFAPSVLDEAGEPQLVWELEVFAGEPRKLHHRVLVDAINGNVVRAWTLQPPILNREIRDKANNQTNAATLARIEGQAPTGNPQVDNAYDYLGDTYGFYFDRHGRDSDNGAGAKLTLTVRYCDTNNPCPWPNANAGLVFGDGFATDDVVAHEFTHRVIGTESMLIYANASGAINESLCDVWGDFIDQLNLRGNDALSNRWAIGEDIPGGPLRDMRNPPRRFDPDRLNSPLYVAPTNNPTSTNDWGGVHSNSGVNNKLCYLLTDGDTFNGQTVSGLGILRVADLYYEVNVNLLTSGAGWTDLYNALRRAAVNLGWTLTDRINLYRACLAVEIAGPGENLYVDRSSPCPTPRGLRFCSQPNGPFLTVAQGVTMANPGDVLHIRFGNYNEPMRITNILILNSYDGPATIGRP